MRKNPYAARLQDFSSFVFDDEEIYRLRGGWEKFFLTRMGRSTTKCILEIGCSNAVFLASIAELNSSASFIGMDWKFKIVFKGAKRIAQEELPNVALLRGRAQELAKVFAKDELDEIWVFFPDPWAKKSQLKNRLMQEPFFLDAQACLKANGKIYFKTDHPGYFQWVLALFGEEIPDLPEYGAAHDPAILAERSRKARQIKVRKREDESLPPPSQAIRAAFTLDYSSIDYWGGERPQTLFSETHTLFEKLFVKEQLPIYYLELSKR